MATRAQLLHESLRQYGILDNQEPVVDPKDIAIVLATFDAKVDDTAEGLLRELWDRMHAEEVAGYFPHDLLLRVSDTLGGLI